MRQPFRSARSGVAATSMSRRLAIAAAAVAVGVSGCGSGDSGSRPPPPSATATPTTTTSGSSTTPTPSATDVKALAYAGATAATRRFFDTLYKVTADGGAHPEQLEAVATGPSLSQAKLNAQLYRERGWKAVSPAIIKSITPTSYTPSNNQTAQVQLLVCLDSTNAKAVDGTGKAVTKPKGAGNIFPYQVATQQDAGSDTGWIVSNITDKVKGQCG